jgi:Cu(I)/Ag(I) efflux system periplasmic protein CusF
MQTSEARRRWRRVLAAAALMAGATLAIASSHLTDGEVRKVDKAAGKITLKHGEIKNLEMPGMTMVFQVKDTALLDTLQPGDKVRFAVEKVGTAYVVTTIEPAK